MATFVLVHGGWHGGWCWRDVAPALRAAGHEVHAPTLTGLGARAHLRDVLGPRLDLEMHVADLVGVLEYEDLSDAVLVGHSYSGMVIAGAADRAAERVSQLIYLDAFVPADGVACSTCWRPSAARTSRSGHATTATGGAFRRRRLPRWE